MFLQETMNLLRRLQHLLLSWDATVMEMMTGKLGGRMYSLGIEFDSGKSVNEIYRPLCSFYRNHHYDIVHIHSSRITMMAMMAAASKRMGISKVIVHSHSMEAKD